jgi:ribonuclease HI
MSTIMEIFADGSLGRSTTAGLGWLLITPEGPVPGFTHHQVGAAQASIQYVELRALKAALQHALSTGHRMDRAAVYTDSLDAIRLVQAELRILTHGHKPGRPVGGALRDLARWVAREVKIADLHLRHVRGHNGTPGNEAADRLALMARRNREYGLGRDHGHTMAAGIAADYTSALTRVEEKHWASPDAIRTHRAYGEPLCAACAQELQTLEREAS